MKKNLIALAALAAVGAASAQSTVSITGLVGAAYQSVDSTSLKPSYPQYVPGVPAAYRGFTLTDATIKVGVVEDLGSGLKAQASIALDSNGTTSTANFAQPLLRRDTSISLSSTTLGAVSFQSTRPTSLLAKGMVAPAYLSDNIYDTTGVTDRQAADVVQYMTPTFSGFSGYVQWVDVANTSVLGSDGKTSYGLDGYATPLVNIGVIGANYAIGSFTGGVAYKAYRGLLPGAIRNNKLEAFVTYDFGVAKIGGGYDGQNLVRRVVCLLRLHPVLPTAVLRTQPKTRSPLRLRILWVYQSPLGLLPWVLTTPSAISIPCRNMSSNMS